MFGVSDLVSHLLQTIEVPLLHPKFQPLIISFILSTPQKYYLTLDAKILRRSLFLKQAPLQRVYGQESPTNITVKIPQDNPPNPNQLKDLLMKDLIKDISSKFFIS